MFSRTSSLKGQHGSLFLQAKSPIGTGEQIAHVR
jgi:hypothetical protein